jgi:hypothetical protein
MVETRMIGLDFVGLCVNLACSQVHAATSEDEFWDDGEGGPVGREPSWFDKQFGGPYLATDTTGINGDDKVYTLCVVTSLWRCRTHPCIVLCHSTLLCAPWLVSPNTPFCSLIKLLPLQ